jgi:hypothetical protein
MTRDSLDCSEVVIRAILSRKWIDEQSGLVDPAAFIPRIEKSGLPEAGISVSRLNLTTVQKALSGFKKTFGAATLHTGTIRDALPGVDVIAEPLDAVGQFEAKPEHALIINLPNQNLECAEAERAATILSRQARLRR